MWDGLHILGVLERLIMRLRDDAIAAENVLQTFKLVASVVDRETEVRTITLASRGCGQTAKVAMLLDHLRRGGEVRRLVSRRNKTTGQIEKIGYSVDQKGSYLLYESDPPMRPTHSSAAAPYVVH